jgi:hypothetical protein
MPHIGLVWTRTKRSSIVCFSGGDELRPRQGSEAFTKARCLKFQDPDNPSIELETKNYSKQPPEIKLVDFYTGSVTQRCLAVKGLFGNSHYHHD